MNPMHEKEPQATVECDPEPGIDRQELHEAWVKVRMARHELPLVPAHDTKGLMESLYGHVLEMNQHQMEAYFCLSQILRNLNDDEW